MNTRKFALRLFVFLLIIVALDQTIGRLLKYFYFEAKSGVNYETTYVMDSTKADIVILGSSRASHHYIPQIIEDSLGMSCYNGGRDGMGIFYCEAVFQSLLERYTPKIVILDVDQGSFYEGNEWKKEISILLPYFDKNRAVSKLLRDLDKTEMIKSWSQIYPFNSTLENVLIRNNIGDFKENKKGFVPLIGVMNNQRLMSYDFKTDMDHNKVESIKRIVTRCKTKNIKLVVIQSPRYKIMKVFDVIQALNKEQNFKYYNLVSDSAFLNHPELFKDAAHLNTSGAELFTKKIILKFIKSSNNE